MKVGIVDLPEDVALQIMIYLDVIDILLLEKTCKHFRNIVGNRHLWLSKMDQLDQTCAPNMQPYVDPKCLSCSELRDVVVEAERAYYLIAKCSSPSLEYKCIKSITIERPIESDAETFKREISIKLTPDCRYLFMLYYTISNSNCELRLLDLEDGGRQIWTSSLATVQASRCIVSYAFEQQTNGSFIVVLSLGKRGAITGYLQVLRLELHTESDGPVREIISSMMELKSPTDRVVVSEQLVAVVMRNSSFIVWNYETGEPSAFRISVGFDFVYPTKIQIWRDNLFCLGYTRGEGGIWVFSWTELHETMVSSYPATVILNGSSTVFKLPKQPVLFSIYCGPWRHDQHTAVISVIGNYAEPRQEVTSVRAIFNRCRHGNERWSSADVQVTDCCWPCVENQDELNMQLISVNSPLSRSGQLPVVLDKARQPYLISLNRSGVPVIRRLSFVYQNPDSQGLSETHLPSVPRNRIDLDSPILNMEPYSGMLFRRIDGSGTESIELYRLA